MYSIHHFFKKILFPERCIVCKKDGAPVCDPCIKLLPYTDTIRHHAHYSEYTLFPYHHKVIKHIIWELKYKNNISLRTRICEILYVHTQRYLPTGNPVYLFAIPKSVYTDSKHRDFDHGFLLASAFKTQIEKHTQISLITDCFIKTTVHRQAAQKTRTERLKSIKGHIIETPRAKKYHRVVNPVIIIDDVVTTGGTRDEMIKMVQKHFTGPIIFIALAH